jgi:hypothetical protein
MKYPGNIYRLCFAYKKPREYFMHASTSHLSGTIFCKTEKGQQEVSHRRFGLDMRQRRILIMMDGTKSLSAIKEMMPSDGLGSIISFLVEQGFVASTDKTGRNASVAMVESASALDTARMNRTGPAQRIAAAAAPRRSPAEAAEVPGLLQDAEKIREVKDFMTTTATTYLGLLSAGIIHRIERAEGAAQLMAEVGPWHMALRESKQGNRFAGPYLEQVTAALTGRAAQLETT